MIKIKKGLNIPISGTPEDKITDFKNPRSVALVGSDYHGLKPAMLVKEGEKVKIGQPLFEDKKNPGVIFTSPGGGIVESINRGHLLGPDHIVRFQRLILTLNLFLLIAWIQTLYH